ncbi:YfiR family protein [Ectopseudomonas mendocina]|uniref:YfiR family protein n=1 Tax=Ectopseudomonas mendocina TaxID=300 RepID=A0ABZ2RK04_ECTME
MISPHSLARTALATALYAALSTSAIAAPADPPCENRAQCRSLHAAQVVLGIINYARWPALPKPLTLCIVGATEYADKLWQNQPLTSRYDIRTKRLLIDNPQLATECNAVYLGAAAPAKRQKLFQILSDIPVLTISEHNQGCSQGSMFCLKVIDSNVGFQINLDAIARSGIRIHPNVLQLGKRAGTQP